MAKVVSTLRIVDGKCYSIYLDDLCYVIFYEQNITSICCAFLFGSNEMLMKNGFKEPKAIKTGTTIVGIIFKDGVVLGADTRATEGPIVADKNCEKIHFLAKNM